MLGFVRVARQLYMGKQLGIEHPRTVRGNPVTSLDLITVPRCGNVIFAMVMKQSTGMEEQLHRVVQHQKNHRQVL